MYLLQMVVLPVLLGVFSSLVVVMLVEYMRRPTLTLNVAPVSNQSHGPDQPAQEMRCLRVRVANNDLPRVFKWMRRETAAYCRATVQFEFLEGVSVFSESMTGRWASSPEPVPMQAEIGPTRFQIWDSNRMGMASEMSIPAGEFEDLDIAVRCDAEPEAYGWNNQSYQPPFWRNPQWLIGKGRYLVRVTIRSAGLKEEKMFHMNNEGQPKDFRLDKGR